MKYILLLPTLLLASCANNREVERPSVIDAIESSRIERPKPLDARAITSSINANLDATRKLAEKVKQVDDLNKELNTLANDNVQLKNQADSFREQIGVLDEKYTVEFEKVVEIYRAKEVKEKEVRDKLTAKIDEAKKENAALELINHKLREDNTKLVEEVAQQKVAIEADAKADEALLKTSKQNELIIKSQEEKINKLADDAASWKSLMKLKWTIIIGLVVIIITYGAFAAVKKSFTPWS